MINKNISKFLNLLLLLISVSFFSCVGTIADKNALSSYNMKGDDDTQVEKFAGLYSATPVAHDKIELVFQPVDVDANKVNYEIYVNNSDYQFVLSGTSLEGSKTVEGNYLYTMTGLDLNTSYEFNIKAVLTGGSNKASRLDPNKALRARTFSNETANFMGISGLELGIGNRSQDTVTVRWIPAEIKGTALNIKANDPIAYEITYWAKGLNEVTKQFPNSIINPTLNKSSYEIITDLTPATTYFFRVRAIHKNYATQILSDATYKKDMNNRVMRITTAKEVNQDLSFINLNELVVSNPIEKRGREEVDLSWYAAWGNEGLYYYKLAYKKINVNLFEHLEDKIGTYEDVLNDSNIQEVDLTSNDLKNTVDGLTPKDWYQFKVFVCKVVTPGIDEECPISTPYKSAQVKPRLTPFSGILTISNPHSLSNLNRLTLNFDSPMVDSGFVNEMVITCYNPTDHTKKIQLPTNGISTGTGTGVTNCDNIKFLPSVTPIPTTTNGFSTLTSLTVEIDQNVSTVAAKTYCFSISPAITYTDLNPVLGMDTMSDQTVKCITPKISAPTMAEFPGREDSCSISGSSITVSWAIPSGGVYSNFVIFWKEKTDANDYFSFPDAVTEFLVGTTTTYQYAQVTSDKFTYKIQNLSEGKDYFVGVLALLNMTSPVVKEFSKFNTRTGICRLPTPKPIFSEWLDLLALGPKIDGLAEGLDLGEGDIETRLYEKFDGDNAPIETASNDAADLITSKEFLNGIARQDKLNPTNFYKNSNTGLVRLVWKDIALSNGESMSDFILRNESDAGTNGSMPRGQRAYGYKVYRSDDNRQSWMDLTTSGPIYPDNLYVNQTVPTSYSKSSGAEVGSVARIVKFDDYTVEHINRSSISDDVDKARIYWYKVVPYFLGKEQDYGDPNNPDHHMIRVTLPPRNMALVHRQIANRTACLELGKNSINKRTGGHYSCSYNGIGATGLNMPWQKGNTVYDLGGDLLIDRFELGCAFTRGSKDGTSFDASFQAKNAMTMGSFKGCINESVKSYEPFSTTAIHWGNNARKVLPGDCHGKDSNVFGFIETNFVGDCPDYPESSTDISFYGRYRFPGAKDDSSNPTGSNRNIVSCSDRFQYKFPMFPSNFFTKPSSDDFPTQSEYGAVYYSRTTYADNWEYSKTLYYQGAVQPGEKVNFEGDDQNVTEKLIGYGHGGNIEGGRRGSSCQVNLSFVKGGVYYPRWIPINQIISGLGVVSKNADGETMKRTTKSLLNKTFTDLMEDEDLYNITDTSFAPGNARSISNDFLKNKPIVKIAASNNAKLPPLDGLSQLDLARTCSLYKVQVGIKKGTGNFVPTTDVLSKRVIRKKEFSISAAWPAHYNEDKIKAVEKGDGIQDCNGNQKVTLAQDVNAFRNQTFRAGDSYWGHFPNHFSDTATSFDGLMITGSSVFDNKPGPYTVRQNTQKCVSKFGVQDLVGNLTEISSEEIFCDFRAETTAKLWVGDYKFGIETAGIDKTKSLPYNEGMYYDSTKNPSGTVKGNAVRVMVEDNIDNNTGSCSTVNRTLDPMSYLSGVNIIPIKKQNGEWNNDIISVFKNQDQEGIDTLRNGDGSFLTFGKDKLVTALDKNNKVKVNDFPYFNPVLGLPILCGSGANCSVNTDNQLGKASIFIGNSSYDNMGVAEKYDFTYPEVVKGSNVKKEFIEQTIINTNLLMGELPPRNSGDYLVTNTLSNNDDEPEYISYSNWSISRNPATNTGDSIRFYNGGSVKKNGTGRFSTTITGYGEAEERWAPSAAGGRCVVLINNN